MLSIYVVTLAFFGRSLSLDYLTSILTARNLAASFIENSQLASVSPVIDRYLESYVPSALLVVDPLNDFVSRRGKGWPLLRTVAGEVNLVDNMRSAIATARRREMPVVYAPHASASQCRTYRHPTPNQDLTRLSRFFDGFGGRFHPDLAPSTGDFVASPHHVSSGFGGTDLHAHLQSTGVDHLVICGLLTNTCIESTARQGIDLGYGVSVLSDAVAAWTPADHTAAVRGSLPLVVDQLITSREFSS